MKSEEQIFVISVVAKIKLTDEEVLIVGKDFANRLQGFETKTPECLKGSKMEMILPFSKNIETVFWNIEKPEKADNYIVNLGTNGVALGWYNGKDWIKMWGKDALDVSGWIEVPKHKKP